MTIQDSAIFKCNCFGLFVNSSGNFVIGLLLSILRVVILICCIECGLEEIVNTGCSKIIENYDLRTMAPLARYGTKG